jgi:hypothetical protein|tara:strand:+ start:9245 stop:11566 length:2322 start_codon:yes stop_codon:yes gene_type:complete
MPLNLVIDNVELNFETMTTEDLVNIQKMVVGLQHAECNAIYMEVMGSSIPALQFPVHEPDWLLSDFQDNFWTCLFGKVSKTIDFNICIDDGTLLTEAKNSRLLYSMKFWLCSVGHPTSNGGVFLKARSIQIRVYEILYILDALLLRSDSLQLSEFGFGLVDIDIVKDVLKRFVTISDGYGVAERLSAILKEKSKEVSDNDVASEALTYPAINKVVGIDRELLLTDEELIKSRVWLLKNGAYLNVLATNRFGGCRVKVILQDVYKNTLHGVNLLFPSYPELRITPKESFTEYPSVPVKNDTVKGESGERSLRSYIRSFKSIHIISGTEHANADVDLSDLTYKSLKDLFLVSVDGRYRSLPGSVVLTSLKNSLEFSIEYGDDILKSLEEYYLTTDLGAVELDSYYDIYSQHMYKDGGLVGARDTAIQNCISSKLKDFGVKRWRLVGKRRMRTLNYFEELRNNLGLVELYQVLMGSIQIILGTLMARRVTELNSLNVDCLYPKLDPTLDENSNVGFYVDFFNQKSGAGEDRERLKRPIMLIGAKFIWKLIKFQESLVESDVLKNNTKLMLTIHGDKQVLCPINDYMYSVHFDTFCDYFETSTMYLDEDTLARFYIRQHQLRRFFAMTFFWGSSFDGLDTLRWFLGHTDIQHLYRYITENTPGSVLRGVKAETILYGINSDKIKGIEQLRGLLKEQYGVDDVMLESLDDLVEDIEEGFVSANVELGKLKSQLSQTIDSLLQNEKITLEPTFASINDSDGSVQQKIHLAIVVKEIEDE